MAHELGVRGQVGTLVSLEKERSYVNNSYGLISAGIYVFKDAEIIDVAAPYGVLSVARRFDPELDAFLIANSLTRAGAGRFHRPAQLQFR